MERRLRALEARAAEVDPPDSRWRTVFVYPGEIEADKIAALPERMPGDDLVIVRFVRPSDVPRSTAH